MHGHGKSDRPVVLAKLPNNPAVAGAEVVEGRGLPEGNTAMQTRPGPSAGLGVSSELDRVRRAAQKDKDVRFSVNTKRNRGFEVEDRTDWCGAVSEMEEPALSGWWSSAAALQGEAANHRKLLRSRAVVVSVCGKAAP